MVDPLPEAKSPLWMVFVLAMSATPILFPVVCACALHPDMSRQSQILSFSWLFITTAVHVGLVCTGIDLATYGVDFGPPIEIWGHLLDGRSIAGKAYGIKFDLLTSIPSARGDCLFLHAMMFTLAVLVTFIMCIKAGSSDDGNGPTIDRVFAQTQRSAKWRLTAAFVIMLFGQVTMIPLLCIVGVARTLDIWHISIFIVMALAYSAIRALVCLKPAEAVAGSRKED